MELKPGPSADFIQEILDGWIDDPPSVEIATLLTETRAPTCPHGAYKRCFLYCGVKSVWNGIWSNRWTKWVAMDNYERRSFIPPDLQQKMFPGCIIVPRTEASGPSGRSWYDESRAKDRAGLGLRSAVD